MADSTDPARAQTMLDHLNAFLRATLDAATEHRVGLKGTAKLQGDRVPAIWWVMRRPVATVRTTLGL